MNSKGESTSQSRDSLYHMGEDEEHGEDSGSAALWDEVGTETGHNSYVQYLREMARSDDRLEGLAYYCRPKLTNNRFIWRGNRKQFRCIIVDIYEASHTVLEKLSSKYKSHSKESANSSEQFARHA